MPNIMTALKSEISRLARKEAKSVVAPVKKASANYRGLIAGLRKQIDALQNEVAALKRSVPKAEKALAAAQERFWITGKGVKTLRKKLGLTQVLFGKLVGVSLPTVGNWEGADGKVDIRRKATVARLQAVRGMGKKQAAEIVGEGKAESTMDIKAKQRGKRKAKKT